MAKIESEKPRLGISACLLGERVRYGALLMKALAVRATPARHASALRHAAGSLEPALGADERPSWARSSTPTAAAPARWACR
jgi:hypothetical protein